MIRQKRDLDFEAGEAGHGRQKCQTPKWLKWLKLKRIARSHLEACPNRNRGRDALKTLHENAVLQPVVPPAQTRLSQEPMGVSN